MSYCVFCKNLPADNVHKVYHDTEYGFPLETDNELFGRLMLEINQAGISWEIILKKKEGFRKAYDNFDIDIISTYEAYDFERLMQDSSIIRNKLKIGAAIHNAKVIKGLQEEFGSFKNWIDHHHPLNKEEWVKIFKKKFKFTGGEIVNSFLMSIGYLPGAHDPDCEIYLKIMKL
jgi:DNA-3-methyladenine glycosylase I